MDVEEQGAGGVRGVGRMDGAAGQVPDHPAVHGAREKITGLRTRPQAGLAVEDPGELGAREVGIEQKPGQGRQPRFDPLFPQGIADGSRATVLPDKGPADGLSGAAVPDHDGLPLIGHPDGRDVASPAASAIQSLAQDGL